MPSNGQNVVDRVDLTICLLRINYGTVSLRSYLSLNLSFRMLIIVFLVVAIVVAVWMQWRAMTIWATGIHVLPGQDLLSCALR